MPVSAFGAPVDLRGWDAFTAETGIPAVLDAAAGVDTLRPGMTPAVVSFHATKPLGIGEGGALVSVDAETIARFRSFANFGFGNGRQLVAALAEM
jgi:dTDP-4-amino-4,6-dideoxygalactose transaminase